jgi:diketogulonate reductase-like aldo/keto reductase
MVTFPGGLRLPSLGLGTWRMGESAARRGREVGAVRAAIDMGWRVIDSAEMYGDGRAEEIVGEAIGAAMRVGAVRREQVFVVSKVYPHNASAAGAVVACERSLSRLRLDHLDGYLLHWRGAVPLAETVDAFEGLRAHGRIRHWGVSNFDVDDMEALARVPGGDRCATNQVRYSLSARGAAFELMPWLGARDIATMAYSPIDQGALARNAALAAIAKRRGVTAAQMALAWLIGQRGIMAIPKAASEAHLRENFAAAEIVLDVEEKTALDRAFPPPKRKTPLSII